MKLFRKKMPKEDIDMRKASLTGSLFSAISIVLLLLFSTSLSACSDREAQKVVLTTGFNEDEIFKIEDSVCTLPEIKVYLINLKNRYENVYGPGIWNTNVEGKSLAEAVKDNALADISQIKAMNIQAGTKNISLSESELELASQAGKEYYDSLNSAEIQYFGVDAAVLTKMYEEYALANKLYEEIIQDITPEVSDDEARTITVQQILIKTYSTDDSGNKIEYSQDEKKTAFERAQTIHDFAVDGEHDFEELIDQYSEGEEKEYSFCKGEMDIDYETAAFNLGKDEISDIITTQYGYHILKCITTFNREETDINKISIIETEKERVFGEQYDEEASKLLTYLNEDLWNSLKIKSDLNITTDSFFEIYKKYFE